MKKLTLILMALVAMFSLAACSDSNNPVSPNGPDAIATTTAADDSYLEAVKALNADKAMLGDFDTLLAGLKSQSLVRPLIDYGNTTVFAPTDDAFAALGLDETNIADLPDLRNILLYHVVDGKLFAADVLAMPSITMANGDMTTISTREDGAYINDSRIDETDIQVPTGVVHVINAVLLPAK